MAKDDDIPMGDILQSVKVHDKVREALLFRRGDYGAMLTLIERLETAECGPALLQALDALHLAPAELHAIQLAAFEWVNDYVQGVSGAA